MADDGQPEPRFQIMLIILVISLLAVSFPGVSESVPFLRIPHIVFFIGKHFGTGVILATAFIHLLQDSFEDLQKPEVAEHFHHIGEHTGLVILASLLLIFLIEYVSTSYVQSLQEKEPSLPLTPIPPSAQCSVLRLSSSVSTPVFYETYQPSNSASQHSPILSKQAYRTEETTSLLAPPRTQSTHHLNSPHTTPTNPRIIGMRRCACGVGCPCAYPDSVASIHSPTALSQDVASRGGSRSSSPVEGEGLRMSNAREEGIQRAESMIGRRRQVVGLLVLQLGIMIHSIVIGLTLAIATGADFTSLTTAIIFHQLFEGLSLGIRIAALPPPPLDNELDEESETEGFSKPKVYGYHGFVNNVKRIIGGERGEGWLKCSLALLFAITAPAGMGLGMIVFQVRKQKQGVELARMYLIEGLMSAISAGMLIYVATVEMIAGDFVFGDVDGHSHHGHSHDIPSAEDEERGLPSQANGPRSPNTGQLSAREENGTGAAELDDPQYRHHHRHHGKVGKKVLAVLSLFGGVGGMVLISLGE